MKLITAGLVEIDGHEWLVMPQPRGVIFCFWCPGDVVEFWRDVEASFYINMAYGEMLWTLNEHEDKHGPITVDLSALLPPMAGEGI